MTLEPIQNLFFFIKGVYNVIIDNWLLSIPIAMSVLYYAIKLLYKVFSILKKGGN